MMKKIHSVFLMILIAIQIINAQSEIPFNHINLEYKDYMSRVRENNLEYAAEKLNSDLSEAALNAARFFQDPIISLDINQDMESSSISGHGISSELTKTIDLGGERKVRIDLTLSEKDLTSAILADYFRNLQAEATLLYLEGMKQKQLYIVSYDSYKTMKTLYRADSMRLKLGSIMEIDAIQSKLEAGILFNGLLHSLAQWKNSLAQISLMTGTNEIDILPLPSSHLHDVARDFELNELISEALQNRADLQAALLNKEVAQKALRLTRKERNTDLDLKFGYSNYTINDGVSPKSTGLTAGVAIPLKFSNAYKGEITMAEIKVQQADELYQHAELQISTEIIQAYEMYQNYCKQVQNFDEQLLEDAENVRKGKIYSYQRGETSLLEVLNAQRTYNDIQTSYYEAIFSRAAALVELEKAAGIWDINF